MKVTMCSITAAMMTISRVRAIFLRVLIRENFPPAEKEGRIVISYASKRIPELIPLDTSPACIFVMNRLLKWISARNGVKCDYKPNERHFTGLTLFHVCFSMLYSAFMFL